jgi:membrane protein
MTEGPMIRWVPQPLRHGAVLLRSVAAETIRGFQADRGVDLAASLAFSTLLMAVPLLATFSLLLATFFEQNANEILDMVNAILPYHTARVTDNLREFMGESTAISGIGLALLLVASLRLVFTVEGVFNAVWGAPRRRNLMARTAIYSLVLFALALLLGALALGLRLLRRTPAGGALLASPLADTLFPITSEVVALTVLYRFLPNARVRWGPAIACAGLVTWALEGLRFLFGLYVRALSRVNLITGSLTLVLLTLLSVYFVWVLILLGVELTSVLQTHVSPRRTAPRERAGPAENAVRMLVRLAAGGSHRVENLFDSQDAQAPEMERILGQLAAAGLVTGSAREGFGLARAPERIRVAQVVDAVAPDLYTVAADRGDAVALALGPLLRRAKAAQRSLMATTIADLRGGED